MNFADAIKICFKKYANFNGRASRSEFWYFFLFFYAGLAVVALLIFSVFDDDAFSLFFIYIFGLLLPYMAVAARRLHDTNKSGWWQITSAIPYVGGIAALVLLVIWATEGDKKDNRFGKNIYKKRKKKKVK
jgi:uncharacterized membrane protein YhaH (DUF805 family)|tara:strand:+ start:3294 stop:3686 length:393 start_codon:yes stop_codon:yes gene_type:complete